MHNNACPLGRAFFLPTCPVNVCYNFHFDRPCRTGTCFARGSFFDRCGSQSTHCPTTILPVRADQGHRRPLRYASPFLLRQTSGFPVLNPNRSGAFRRSRWTQSSTMGRWRVAGASARSRGRWWTFSDPQWRPAKVTGGTSTRLSGPSPGGGHFRCCPALVGRPHRAQVGNRAASNRRPVPRRPGQRRCGGAGDLESYAPSGGTEPISSKQSCWQTITDRRNDSRGREQPCRRFDTPRAQTGDLTR
jgi:hypothetical protein